MRKKGWDEGRYPTPGNEKTKKQEREESGGGMEGKQDRRQLDKKTDNRESASLA